MKTKILILTISALILGAAGSILATGSYAHQAGYQPSGYGAIGDYSTATGYKTKASGSRSIAMGVYTEASGYISTAMGYETEASGNYSTAMGSWTEVSGNYSTVMGRSTKASGDYSTAIGHLTKASGHASTAMGFWTVASGDYQTVMGKYNTPNTSQAFIIGNGTGDDSDDRSNVFTIDWNGKVYSNGNFPISDARLKTNIETIKNPLDKILKLRGVSYEWIPEQKRFKGYKPEIGLIAQEVEKVVPEVVSTDKDADSKGRHLKSVAYEKMVGLLIEGIKEQQKELEDLRKENREMREEIKNILERLKK